MHYYKFNIGDWALHTSHLSLEEEAIYFRLINFYYDTEKPIPLETQTVFRRLRFGSNLVLADSILNEFFQKTEKGFVHSRCEELIKDYRKTAKKNKANGAKGGRPRKDAGSKETQKKPNGLPDETQDKPKDNPNYKLETTNQELETNNQFNDVLDHFNLVAGRQFKTGNEIKARLKDYTVNCLKLVIDYKTKEWKGTDMEKYLRPQTLFGKSKFEGYLNDARSNLPIGKQSNTDQTFNNLLNANLPDLGGNHGQPDTIQTINGGAVIGLPESNDTGNDSNVLDDTWELQP